MQGGRLHDYCGDVASGTYQLGYSFQSLDSSVSTLSFQFDSSAISVVASDTEESQTCTTRSSLTEGMDGLFEVDCASSELTNVTGSIQFAVDSDIGTTAIRGVLTRGDSVEIRYAVLGKLPSHVRAFADFDWDGRVDFDDFFLLADQFGAARAALDMTGDGVVDLDDFFRFSDEFGRDYRVR
jgi:hypothetical protein